MKIPILYLDNSFTFGGAINSLSHLLSALDKDQFEPVLLTGQNEAFLARHFRGIQFYSIRLRLPWIENRRFKKLLALPIFRNRVLLKAANSCRFIYWHVRHTFPEALMYYRIGKRHRVQLVHLNNILGTQPAGILASKLLGVPCVAHLRDFEEVHWITKLYARLIDHHIAISTSVGRNLSDLKVPESRITLVHDAIDLSGFQVSRPSVRLIREFNLEPGDRIFGIFGRIVRWKGIREFVLASKIVFQKFPSGRAFIVGGISDGNRSYHQEIVELIERLGLKGRIVLTGYRTDTPDLMNLMEVIVHASLKPEPFGMVLIEGMALGKPVIATRGGGPEDIIENEKTGLLVKANSPELGAAIVRLLRDPDLAKQIGENARNRVYRNFNNYRSAGKVEAIYRQMLGRQVTGSLRPIGKGRHANSRH